MQGDPLKYSRDISRVSEDSGLVGAGWCDQVLPTSARQLGWGPAKIVNVQCPIYTSTPGTNNPWGIWVGSSNFQTRFISPGAVGTFRASRLEYLWVRRETDFSGGGDVTTALVVGVDWNYDPPYADFEPNSSQSLRLLERFQETKDAWWKLISKVLPWWST